MNKQTKFSIWYIILAFWAIMLIQNVITQAYKVQHLPYSDFLAALDSGRIVELAITQNRIQGKMKTPEGGDKLQEFTTVRVDPELSDKLEKHNIKFTGVIESTFFRDLLSWIVPILLFMGVWYYFFRRMGAQQGFLSLGKNKAKVYMMEDLNVSFNDVAGLDEAKEELMEVVEFLKYPDKFTRIGGRLPRGVLLVGPPGTGKTMLSKATAGESGVPFFSLSGSEFVEMFVGLGAARVRDLFQQAKAKAPCIIFIDELDALGRARGGVGIGGHDEREQTLNQLLVEMDGFDPTQGVILMAATNRPEILDPALLRPGRFDRHILVDKPDKKGREEILRVHIRDVKLAPDVNLANIAAMTPGFAGADLANLVNEAALLAVRRNKETVSNEEFQEAVERVIAGLEKKNRLINEQERRIVAYHEVGHALVGLSLPGADPVQKITIIPRGISALGYTLNVPTEERYLMTRQELLSRIAMALGGRAAEDIVMGDVSTGAHNDLAKATDIARGMVKEYGMDEGLGRVYLESERRAQFLNVPGLAQERQYSEQTAREIDEAVRKIMEDQYTLAKAVLRERRAVLDEGAQMLLEKEKIEGRELEEIMKGHGYTPAPRGLDHLTA
ncbi:MAG: ATP-dependent zinc metalloprotease FtsH [Proteobacteria bacterium]|nr:ATP-dependent zinc metalloprotease FtsH [Pseudomonadota bacterium]